MLVPAMGVDFSDLEDLLQVELSCQMPVRAFGDKVVIRSGDGLTHQIV